MANEMCFLSRDQFIKLMTEKIEELIMRVNLFKIRVEDEGDPLDVKILTQYTARLAFGKMMLDEFLRKTELGIELVPFFMIQGYEIIPGYIHKTDLEDYNKWVKFAEKNNNKKAVYI